MFIYFGLFLDSTKMTECIKAVTSSTKSKLRCEDIFYVHEDVLAFDGPWLYYAKILNVQDTHSKRSNLQYKIHYEDWSQDYDDGHSYQSLKTTACAGPEERYVDLTNVA